MDGSDRTDGSAAGDGNGSVRDMFCARTYVAPLFIVLLFRSGWRPFPSPAPVLRSLVA